MSGETPSTREILTRHAALAAENDQRREAFLRKLTARRDIFDAVRVLMRIEDDAELLDHLRLETPEVQAAVFSLFRCGYTLYLDWMAEMIRRREEAD